MATTGSGAITQSASDGESNVMKHRPVEMVNTNVMTLTQPKDTTMRTMLTSLTARDMRSPVLNRLKKVAPWY